MNYYSRSGTTHLDGTRIFQSEDDRKSESDVANCISREWQCELHQFGALAPIDWYATRHGRLVGLLELKTRSHVSTKFESVFLNARKWLALSLGSVGMGVPSIFVVRFTDDTLWTPVALVDASQHRIAGCSRLVKSSSDVEPVIDVPINVLRPIAATDNERVSA